MLIFYAPQEEQSAEIEEEKEQPSQEAEKESSSKDVEKESKKDKSKEEKDVTLGEKDPDGKVGEGNDKFIKLSDKEHEQDEKKKKEKKPFNPVEVGGNDMIDIIVDLGFAYADRAIGKVTDKVTGVIDKTADKIVDELDKIATPQGKKDWAARKEKWDKFVKDAKKGTKGKDKKMLEAGIKAFEGSDQYKNQVSQSVEDLEKEGQNSKSNKKKEKDLVTKAKGVDGKINEVNNKKDKNKKRSKNLENVKNGNKKRPADKGMNVDGMKRFKDNNTK